MASRNRPGSDQPDPEPTGATEPITLTDPDGAVTRVAPWSSWTREQVRAPGGEPALVTRLEQGQLWFSAGRRRSPWRHEVHVGPAIVSTPRGRFHATAEADGGATIDCLAGRTRVVAGLREPVLLGPDQSAAVSSDGRTLVVMDRTTAAAVVADGDVIDLTDGTDEPVVGVDAATEPELAAVGTSETNGNGNGNGHPATVSYGPHLLEEPEPEEIDDEVEIDPEAGPAEESGSPPARLGWIPELVAVASLVVLVVAAVWVFTQRDDTETATPPTATAVTSAPATSATSTLISTTAPTTASTTPAPTTTTGPPRASGAVGLGELVGCQRADNGVAATVAVSHRSGPASAFRVTATVVDASGNVMAEGTADSDRLEPGGTADVEVPIEIADAAGGACELGDVTGIVAN